MNHDDTIIIHYYYRNSENVTDIRVDMTLKSSYHSPDLHRNLGLVLSCYLRSLQHRLMYLDPRRRTLWELERVIADKDR
jgi:hypothetical protein